MALSGLSEESRVNPLDVVERIASVNDWSFERAGDDEITILIAGLIGEAIARTAKEESVSSLFDD